MCRSCFLDEKRWAHCYPLDKLGAFKTKRIRRCDVAASVGWNGVLLRRGPREHYGRCAANGLLYSLHWGYFIDFQLARFHNQNGSAKANPGRFHARGTTRYTSSMACDSFE